MKYHHIFLSALKGKFKSTNSALIFQKLEYWSSKYPQGFYKFLEPCKSPLYREGDSWVEELGISRITFNKSFERFGVRYRSKSAFLQSQDKFQGKAYASYYDRKTNRMYFIRNNDVAKDLAQMNAKNSFSRSCTERKFRSFAPAYKDLSSKQKNTSSLKSNKTEIKVFEISKRMEEIWKKRVGETGIEFLSKALKSRMAKIFENDFNSDLEKWENYCKQIASSKFLMGGANNKFFKKAWLTWAIKPENIERVRAGDFQLGDRQKRQYRSKDQEEEVLKLIEKHPREIHEQLMKFASNIGFSSFLNWFRIAEFYTEGNELRCYTENAFQVNYINSHYPQFLRGLETIFERRVVLGHKSPHSSRP